MVFWMEIDRLDCLNWYNLYNLKNVNNAYGSVLLLVTLQASLQIY